MSQPLRLTVLTPVEVIWEVENVRWVQAQLADGGGIGIWPGHAPLLAETVTAPLRYADETGERTLDLAAGVLQIAAGAVTILTSGFTDAAGTEESPHAIELPAEAYGRLARTLLGASSDGRKDADE